MSTRSGTILLHNLVKIELKYCYRCKQIPALGHLPYLVVVEIAGLHNVKSIGNEFMIMMISVQAVAVGQQS